MTRTRDFDELYRSVGPPLWRALYAYTGGRRDLADDAVAEAFARALEHDIDIRDPRPWLFRTAFRIAASELKRSPHELHEAPEPSINGPDVSDLVAALRHLSPSQRSAVFLHYQADLPVREVARLMGTSVMAVKVHLFRGRERLRSLLGTEEVEDD